MWADSLIAQSKQSPNGRKSSLSDPPDDDNRIRISILKLGCWQLFLLARRCSPGLPDGLF
jgi:hypothetical protein